MEFDFETIGHKLMRLNARRVREPGHHSDFILLAIEDITARQQAAYELTVSEIRYRRLFEAAKDGILILDPDTRQITDANPFIAQLLGYTREEMIGKELFEIGLLKDEEASQAAFRDRFFITSSLPSSITPSAGFVCLRPIRVKRVNKVLQRNQVPLTAATGVWLLW